MKSNGVLPELSKIAIDVGKNYTKKLQSSVKENVAQTLDVKSFVKKVANQPKTQANSPAYKVDISATAKKKAVA